MYSGCVVAIIMAPKVFHILVSGTCEYDILLGKRDFKDMIKNLGIRRLSRLALYIIKRGLKRVKEDVITKAKHHIQRKI